MPTKEPPDPLQTAAVAGVAKGRNIHDVVHASTVSLSPSVGVVDDDDELSDETISRLLREAEQRMRASSAALSVSSTVPNKVLMTKCVVPFLPLPTLFSSLF